MKLKPVLLCVYLTVIFFHYVVLNSITKMQNRNKNVESILFFRAPTTKNGSPNIQKSFF